MQSFNHQEPSGERDMGDQGKSTGHDVDEQPYHNGAPLIRLDGKLTLGERPQHGGGAIAVLIYYSATLVSPPLRSILEQWWVPHMVHIEIGTY